MDANRFKKTAEWFYSNVFRNEAIRPQAAPAAEKVPSLLRTARSLETSMTNQWQSRESIFLKQAKLLANYEDDYEFLGTVVRYYPTYQALTDQELRGYFSWRTKLRGGDIQPTSLSFAFLYIYELINQIGVTDPMDGYCKLKAFQDRYGQIDSKILSYTSKWLTEYVIYYNLNPILLQDSQQVLFDKSITVLDQIQSQDDPAVMLALKHLSPKWLGRSKFYAANQSDCDRVIVKVLRRVSRHYAAHTKHTMTEQYFGYFIPFPIQLFNGAVFCNPLKIRNHQYTVDERCVYRCQNGLWTVTKHGGSPGSSSKLENLLKTIDAVMREEYAYKHPLKYAVDTKWLLQVIREEVQSLLAEQQAAAAKKITIDYSRLEKIRQDAAVTMDKLTVEEELEPDDAPEIPEELPAVSTDTAPPSDWLLSEPELRLLRSLLQGSGIGWVHSEGHLLSVLVDGINEKLYDTFLDSVLEDTPALVEDYINELKEMLHL